MASIKPQTINLYASIDGVFTDQELNAIVELGLHKTLDESIIDDASLSEQRRSTNAWLFPDADNAWLYDRMHAVIRDLNRRFFNYDINMFEPFQFAQYDASRNEFYGRHLDTTFGESSPAASRKLSITLQLTHGADYAGGELRLYQGAEPVIAPKKKGQLVVFPSFIMHEVTPVTAGTRHSLVTWCHGPLFR